MICVTDRTLSCIDGLPHDKPLISRFLMLLAEMDPGAIELSERVYRLLSPLPDYPCYVLRVDSLDNVAQYPRVSKFVCMDNSSGINNHVDADNHSDSGSHPAIDKRIFTEIRVDAADEIGAVINNPSRRPIRVTGMDDALCADYRRIFPQLLETFSDIEYSPSNRCYCATALAVEWATMGGCAVTSFGGFGDFAPTEEVIMAMRTAKLRGANRSYGILPEMAALFRKITRWKVRPNKPVIGERIFHVESGVHVDGILKRPECYEPFPPGVVGQTRRIVLGKQSGLASIRAKLWEHNITLPEAELPLILSRVKAKAAITGRAVSNPDFVRIAMEPPA